MLDVVTIIWAHLHEGVRQQGVPTSHRPAPATWLANMARIFTEENVRYRVDEQGGVHFAIDEEFERNRTATLGILSDGRYANVLNQFNEAHRAFDAVPPNGKTAIRATFAAAEALFRLMFPSAPRLTSKEIDKHLAPTLRLVHAGDATALNAGSKLLASFKEWVDAAHFYRHEQGKETIVQPPLALAINVVSLGASYIRWLGEIDMSSRSP